MTTTQSHTFYFPIEIKVRDLDPRLYLALKSLRPGRNCVIGHYSEIHRLLDRETGPFLYFDKGRQPKSGRYSHITANGGLAVLLDEEGGIFANEDIESKIRLHPDNIREAALVCLWGPRQLELIRRHYPDQIDSSLQITGNPRFDLKKPAFNAFYDQLRPARFRSGRPYILINTVFEYINYINDNTALSYEEELATIDKTWAQVYDLRKAMCTYQAELVKHFIKGTAALARAFPEVDIILRPHPMEETSFYTDRLPTLNNLFVIKQGNVQEWIVGACIIIHHDCTTAVEAFFNDKPVLCYAPILNMELVQDLPVAVSHIVHDQSELLDLCRVAVKGFTLPINPHLKTKQNIVRKHIANYDFSATERIVQAADRLMAEATFPQRTAPLPRQYSWLRIALYHIKQKLTAKHRLKPAQKKLNQAKFQGLSLHEMHRKIALIRALDSEIPKTTISRLAPSTYRITRKTA